MEFRKLTNHHDVTMFLVGGKIQKCLEHFISGEVLPGDHMKSHLGEKRRDVFNISLGAASGGVDTGIREILVVHNQS